MCLPPIFASPLQVFHTKRLNALWGGPSDETYKPRSRITEGVARERPDKSQKDANFADVKGGVLSNAQL